MYVCIGYTPRARLLSDVATKCRIIVDLAAVLHHWVQASSLSLNYLAAKMFSKLAPPPIYVSNIFLVLFCCRRRRGCGTCVCLEGVNCPNYFVPKWSERGFSIS